MADEKTIADGRTLPKQKTMATEEPMMAYQDGMSFQSDGSIELRAIEREDLRQLATWRNAPSLRGRTREVRALNMENQEAWFKRISEPQSHDFMFIVACVAPGQTEGPPVQGRPIGCVGLCHWSPRDRTAESSFYIGDPAARGLGYANRALTLLHRWGFEELGLDKIWSECYVTNELGLRTLAKQGFQREGVLRRHVLRGGERVDSIMLGLLREEWKP